MYSFEFLTSSVSDGEPCGPDLDLAFDDAFMQFMATADSILPESGRSAKFFEFDRVGAQLAKKIESMKGLLETTRDLRLLAALAKMQILDRQTEHFVTTIRAIEFLITERWQDVHPQAEDGDYTLRINSVEGLDDFTQIALPVQHATLFRSKRHGAITFRHYQLSSAAIERREIKEGELEPVIDQANFEAMIDGSNESTANDVDIRELLQSRECFVALKQALTGIQEKSQELLDFQGSIKLNKFFLSIVNDIAALLEKSITRRDPTQSAAPAVADGSEAQATDVANGAVPGAVSMPAGAVASLADVTLALRAVGGYFATYEPSSPALLLVRQAQGLVGRGFFDALRALLPRHASEANLLMGATPGFDMSVERLAEVAGEYMDTGGAQSEPEEAMAEYAEPSSSSEENSASEDGGEGDAATDEGSAAETGDAASAAADDMPATADTASARAKIFHARSRAEAMGLLAAIQKYYGAVEPSSPIPLLIERARALGSLEFSALLKLVMPKEAFRRSDDY